MQPRAPCAETRDQFIFGPTAQVTDFVNAHRLQIRLCCCANSPQHRHGLLGQEILGFSLADHCKALRLVEFRGDFGQKFIMAQANRPCKPQFGFHPVDQARQHHSGRVTMQFACAR